MTPPLSHTSEDQTVKFPRVRGRVALILASAFLLAEFAIILVLVFTDQNQPRPQQFIIVGILSSVFWALILLITKRLRGQALKSFISAALAVGLLARLALVIGVPEQTHMSDDVYRYIWDGKVTAHGMNPFGFSPEQLSFTALPDTTIFPHVNHPELPTIYPPMSQFFFVIAYLINPDSVYGFKVVSLLIELLSLLIFWRLAKEYALSSEAVLIYWLAPLALLEFSYSAHHDVLALPFVGLALIFFKRRLPGWTASMLLCGVLCKFILGLIVPALFLAFHGKDRLKFIIAAICTTLALYLPYWFILHPPELFGSLFTYLSRWQYNGSIYTIVERGLSLFTDSSMSWARAVTGAALITTVILILRNAKDHLRSAGYSLLAYVCLTPTLFPWYLAMFFPLMIIRRAPAVVALMSLVWLSYWGMIGFLETGLWYDNYWLRSLSYLPFYLLILIPGLRFGLFEEPQRLMEKPA